MFSQMYDLDSDTTSMYQTAFKDEEVAQILRKLTALPEDPG